jgi:hypothetical protein
MRGRRVMESALQPTNAVGVNAIDLQPRYSIPKSKFVIVRVMHVAHNDDRSFFIPAFNGKTATSPGGTAQ